MKQNIYNNRLFFEGYMDLRERGAGYNAEVEEPAVYGLLPRLEGLHVLDIGCGFGKFAGYCLKRGAAEVTGTDISEKMISEAKARVNNSSAHFTVIPAEDIDQVIDDESVDLAVSSMCFHYIKDIEALFRKVSKALKPGGHFIFSVEHPICTSLLKGWCCSDAGEKRHWPVDDYREEGMRLSKWFVDGVIKYHRTVETYVNALLDAGFSLKRLLEPGPSAESVGVRPELAEHLRRPPVLVIAGVLIRSTAD